MRARNISSSVLLVASMLAFPLFLSAQAAPPEDKTVTLHLSDGTVLTGEIVDEADGKIRLRTEHVGEVEVNISSIVERTAGHAKPPAAETKVAPPATTAAPLASATPATGVSWTRTFGIGGSYASAPYQQGPIEGSVPNVTGKDLHLPGAQFNAQAVLSLARNAATTGWWLLASVTYVDAQPTGRLTEAYNLETNYTHFYRQDDYFFTRFEFKKDAVRKVDDDVIQTFGLGRRLRNSPHLRIDFLPGINFRRQSAGTPYDGQILVGYGFMEMITASNSHGVGFDQRLLVRTLLQHSNLFAIEAVVGVRAPITKIIALTVNLTHTYDRLLGTERLEIPANAFYPGSPAAFFLANNRSNTQLTTGLQVRF